MDNMKSFAKQMETCTMAGCNKPVYSITGIFDKHKHLESIGYHCIYHFQEWSSKIAMELFEKNDMILCNKKTMKPVDIEWMKTTFFTKRMKD